MVSALQEVLGKLTQQPETMMFYQVDLGHQYIDLVQNTIHRLFGEDEKPLVPTPPRDRRFKDEAWNENLYLDFVRQSYLMTSQWMNNVVNHVEGVDSKTTRQASFCVRQTTDALCPGNFPLINPQIIRETIAKQGQNLVQGMENLCHDVQKGGVMPQISTTDMNAFKLGENIATTKGEVIYRNDIMELLWYYPTKKKIHAKPLLIVTAWINKYYILDLRPENSFVKWALDQGYQVFLISWVNPDASYAEKGFEDYMAEGPITALDVIRKHLGPVQIATVGYCLGGTLLAATLAYLAHHEFDWVASATFFTTQIDFTNSGDLSIFIDDQQLAALDEYMEKKGFLDGTDIYNTFNLLRNNDMIWSFVVNNYMLGKSPIPFDLLYWNADSSRMPKAMHSFYLRNLYQHNLLAKPGGITLLSTPIDIRRIKVPCYMVSTIEDHIAPWQSVYEATQVLTCPLTFVLGGSGHIAGIINHPAQNKYSYWLNEQIPNTPTEWYDGAVEHDGSWWKHWDKWQKPLAGKKIDAELYSEHFASCAIIPAPGAYVKKRYDGLNAED